MFRPLRILCIIVLILNSCSKEADIDIEDDIDIYKSYTGSFVFNIHDEFRSLRDTANHFAIEGTSNGQIVQELPTSTTYQTSLNCDNSPAIDDVIFILWDTQYLRVHLEKDGTIPRIVCPGTGNVSVSGAFQTKDQIEFVYGISNKNSVTVLTIKGKRI